MRTPLAWKNLTASRSKFLLSATGVGFAVLLMFMQIGFRNALFDSNVEMINLFEADVIMVSPARFNLSSERRFNLHWLQRAAASSGVRAVGAVRTERNMASVKVEGFKARTIRVLAIDPDPEFFTDDSLAAALSRADEQRSVLVDRRSKAAYGFSVNEPDSLRAQHVELNGTQIRLADTFTLGTDFANDGTLLMSNRTYPLFFPFRSPTRDPMDLVDIGLIKLKAGVDAKAVVSDLSRLSPEEVSVYSRADFVAREVRFWSRNTPIGIIFGIGTIMGLIVGAIICYQIQFTDISEHMPELATLKAMGYNNRYFLSLVLWQSFYLACIGFIPGLLITWSLYDSLASLSGLVMRLTWPRVALVWSLTLGMCLCSGMLALRRLWRADPASLF
ncbi:MAG: FtsX-like permease family protein [Pirellulaceae bacterium]|nr:FtsX-like permease family protein [Pirellulaceae bacterium]